MINVNLLHDFKFWLKSSLNWQYKKYLLYWNALIIQFLNYNEISYWFICKFDFQYKSKATIMLYLVLPLVGIMKIMKINQYQIE
jgi:hypothetical protein